MQTGNFYLRFFNIYKHTWLSEQLVDRFVYDHQNCVLHSIQLIVVNNLMQFSLQCCKQDYFLIAIKLQIVICTRTDRNIFCSSKNRLELKSRPILQLVHKGASIFN